MKTIEVNDVVQILDSCPLPSCIGLLGYAGETTGEKTAVTVYAANENIQGNAVVLPLTIATKDLFVVGKPDLLPNG